MRVKGTSALNGIPVLCRFWREDGVWNGVAEELPIAVFGKTFETAKENLREAIENYCLVMMDAGQFASLVRRLRSRSRTSLAIKSMSPGSPLVKMLLATRPSGRLTVAA